MAYIIETTPEGCTTRNVPGKSRILDELKKVFPGARFVLANLVPTGGTEAVPCMELRYNPPAPMHGDAPVCAVPVGVSDNDRALAPIALMRHAFGRFGFSFSITEIVSSGKTSAGNRAKMKPVDRIWKFTYVQIKAEEKPTEAITPAEPDTKESVPNVPEEA